MLDLEMQVGFGCIFDWGYRCPKVGYPNFNLLITLLTKSHEPLSRGFWGVWA